MKARPLSLVASAVALASACRDGSPPTAVVRSTAVEAAAAATPRTVLPTGKAIGTLSAPMAPRTKYRLEYHDGMVVSLWNNMYYIWYGNWSNDPSTVSILTDLAISIGGSPYFSILTRYPDGTGEAPNGGLTYGGAAIDAYSRGATLADDDIWLVVKNAIETGALPMDSRGVYVVLTSPDVTASSGYGTTYCAFHQKEYYYGSYLRWVFVGGASRAPTQCAPQMVSPNGNYQADAMASLLAAEVANSTVSPYLNAYYDRLGYEPADKCAWTYGTTYQAPNGSLANVRLGIRDFLLQQLWVPAKSGGRCAMTP